MSLERETDKLLVQKVLNGNERAFHKLYEMYSRELYGYCFRLLKSKNHAEEIIQEVFLKVWIHRESLDPNRSFKSYLYTITRNLSFNRLKKIVNNQKLRQELLNKSKKPRNTTEDYIIYKEYTALKNTAIEKLPPKCKRIFEMSRNEGKSHKEISKELGISESTVKGHMNKALKTIRLYIQTRSDISLLFALLLLQR